MDYNYKITHKPGKYNIEDYLSRNPVEMSDATSIGEETESYVAFISEHSIPRAITREELIEHTASDKSLQALISYIRNHQNETSDVEMTQLVKSQFSKIRIEISITNDDLVMRGSRIVL
jgi:hypothetical protein